MGPNCCDDVSTEIRAVRNCNGQVSAGDGVVLVGDVRSRKCVALIVTQPV